MGKNSGAETVIELQTKGGERERWPDKGFRYNLHMSKLAIRPELTCSMKRLG